MIKSAFVLWLTVMLAIAMIDWFLGPTAEYLNAYEIVRRTFLPSLPQSSEQYLFGQERWGAWALLVGWFAWTIEATLAALLLKSLADFSRLF